MIYLWKNIFSCASMNFVKNLGILRKKKTKKNEIVRQLSSCVIVKSSGFEIVKKNKPWEIEKWILSYQNCIFPVKKYDETIGCYFTDSIHQAFRPTHCAKSVQMRSFSVPYFPRSGLNTGRYGVSLLFSPNAGKYEPEKSPYLNNFHAVILRAEKNKPLKYTNAYQCHGCLNFLLLKLNFKIT